MNSVHTSLDARRRDERATGSGRAASAGEPPHAGTLGRVLARPALEPLVHALVFRTCLFVFWPSASTGVGRT